MGNKKLTVPHTQEKKKQTKKKLLNSFNLNS